MSKWSNHNEYSNTHNATTNNFVAWKYGHVVAAVLSRAQLRLKIHFNVYIVANYKTISQLPVNIYCTSVYVLQRKCKNARAIGHVELLGHPGPECQPLSQPHRPGQGQIQGDLCTGNKQLRSQ